MNQCLKSCFLVIVVMGLFLNVNSNAVFAAASVIEMDAVVLPHCREDHSGYEDAKTGCGQLKIQNNYITPGDTVKIQIIPSPFLKAGNHRWVYRNQASQKIYFENDYPSRYDRRLSEYNYTLSLEDVQNRDEGNYTVQCWTDYSGIFSTNSVDLKLSELLVTTTKPTTNNLGRTIQAVKTSPNILSSSVDVKEAASVDQVNPNDKVGKNSTLIMVIITGAVALVLAAVIVIVIWKRRALKKECNSNGESARIIGNNVGNDYEVVDGSGAIPDHPSYAHNSVVNNDISNSIDQCPGKNKPLCSASTLSTDEYSHIIPKSLKQEGEKQNSGQTISDDKTEEYAVVIRKSARAGNQCENNMTNNNIIDSRDKDSYAAVASKTVRHAAREKTYSRQDVGVTQGNQYSNILKRSIENITVYSQCEYSQVIPKTQRLLDIHGIDTTQTKGADQREIKKHEYDTPSPIIRRKTGVKELQYIEIEHSDTSSNRSQSTESLSARPIEYVDIDFTKKAFVAPKRFPPPQSLKQKN